MWHLLDCCMVIWLVNGNIGSNTFVQGIKIMAVTDIIKVLPLAHWCVQYTLKWAGLWLPGCSHHFDTVDSLSKYTNFLFKLISKFLLLLWKETIYRPFCIHYMLVYSSAYLITIFWSTFSIWLETVNFGIHAFWVCSWALCGLWYIYCSDMLVWHLFSSAIYNYNFWWPFVDILRIWIIFIFILHFPPCNIVLVPELSK